MRIQVFSLLHVSPLLLIAACSASDADDDDATDSLTVTITEASCGNKTIAYGDEFSGYAYDFTLQASGTATGSGMVTFFIEDGIYTLGTIACDTWTPVNGGCAHSGSDSSTIQWSASQVEGDFVSGELPVVFTVSATQTVSSGIEVLDSTQVSCGP